MYAHVVLGMEPRTLCMLGEVSITELPPPPQHSFKNDHIAHMSNTIEFSHLTVNQKCHHNHGIHA